MCIIIREEILRKKWHLCSLEVCTWDFVYYYLSVNSPCSYDSMTMQTDLTITNTCSPDTFPSSQYQMLYVIVKVWQNLEKPFVALLTSMEIVSQLVNLSATLSAMVFAALDYTFIDTKCADIQQIPMHPESFNVLNCVLELSRVHFPSMNSVWCAVQHCFHHSCWTPACCYVNIYTSITRKHIWQ